MQSIYKYLIEKLIINKSVTTKPQFSDEELRNDYKAVKDCFSKSDKKPYMEKYGVTQNKIDVIQKEILNLLKENRKYKKEFTVDDVQDFYRMNIPDTIKSEVFFDDEPIEFIEYIKYYFENESIHFKRAQQSFRRVNAFSSLSAADRHQLNMYNNVCKYIETHKK